ncbi:hypothetical protein GCM10010967_09700 [Dyadobacter beijingensis]|uniref:DUF1735 domain-containing protein n=1 Tax=Dyadobacter beijingensis TaxID=365489 RepID=A0ABQ2HHI1_9BACT|nr:hypothetical protein [Dyadobacter beijingensis]GGM79966.1 hypothetical protein GCM10010967_09700 [Dyadobacter beijingensis]
MKLFLKYIITCLAAACLLTSCYDEPDLFDDLLVSNGKVAQIAVVWLGDAKVYNAAGVLQTTTTVDSLSTVNVNIEYTSEVGVKEFRVYSAPTATGAQTLLATVPAGAQKYDAELRNYVMKVPVTAPKGKNVTSVIFAEVVADNSLASSQKTATLKTKP